MVVVIIIHSTVTNHGISKSINSGAIWLGEVCVSKVLNSGMDASYVIKLLINC